MLRTPIPTVATGILVLLACTASGRAQSASVPDTFTVDRATLLDSAQREFYNARYESAARLTLDPCATGVDGLAACELRTAALLFQVRVALGPQTDKGKAWKECAECPALVAAFKTALTQGQTLARAKLREQPTNDEALFLLGKLDLNYVWLELGTLGHRTGWSEYWEGRRSLDAVLERHPEHVRARVARGWIDYIVATKMRRGTRWLLGGGSKTKGIAAIREAAATEADFFTRTEARFALWDILVRERDIPGALAAAHVLMKDFPENQQLRTFIDTNRSTSSNAGASPAKP
jgi:hypothetical protein